MPAPDLDKEQVTCVLTAQAEVGESPLWHAPSQRLYWLDIANRQLHCFNPGSQLDQVHVLPETPTAIAMQGEAGFILALNNSFALFDIATAALTQLAQVESDRPDNRFNDGRCDGRGRFFAGTMDRKNWQAPAGHLYCLDSERRVHELLSGLVCSNGMDFSPDGRTFYLTESFRYAVFAYDYDPDACQLSRRRAVFQLDPKQGGFPDGLTVDAEGYLWSCIVGLGQIHRYSPDGGLDRVLHLPVPRATACAFGGRDLKTLYIASARETLTPQQLADHPLSGSLFAVRLPVPGQKAATYAG